MRKVILFLITALLIISSCTPNKLNEDQIKAEIDKANYCEKDSDCINIGQKCPFGCSIVVNKNEADRIKNIVGSYKSNCMYGCMPIEKIRCVQNKCIAILNQ